MDTRPVTKEIANAVAAAILADGRSKAQVARLIGMAEATFRRKIAGFVDFTIPELLDIARVLHVDPHTLLPAALRAVA